jgi:hypothetical protein
MLSDAETVLIISAIAMMYIMDPETFCKLYQFGLSDLQAVNKQTKTTKAQPKLIEEKLEM